MSEEEQNKLNKILYYSDIHPADTDFINNIIFNLCQERNIANSILTELEEWLKTVVEYETLHKSGYMTVRGEWGEEVLDKIQELKEKYSIGDKE